MVSHDHALHGIWTVPRGELTQLVTQHEAGEWSLVFSPGVGIAEIEERCLTLARLAFGRWEAVRRRVGKHR